MIKTITGALRAIKRASTADEVTRLALTLGAIAWNDGGEIKRALDERYAALAHGNSGQPREVTTMNQHKCRDIILDHVGDVVAAIERTSDSTGQLKRHLEAWRVPTTCAELGTKLALEAYANLADAYAVDFPDSLLGQDGYYGEHALDMLRAISAWLTMGPKSRLDGGSISHLLCQLAMASGVDENQV